MNVAIYDTEHFETTYTLVRILAVDKNRITIFTTEDVAELLITMPDFPLEVEWCFVQPGKADHAQKIYKYCRSQNVQLLVLSTVNYHHLFFGLACLLLKNTYSILTVHDANGFFNPRFNFSFRKILRGLGKQFLASSVDAFATLLSSTGKYIQNEFNIQKPVFIIPGSFSIECNFSPNISKTTIAVPGSVDPSRRSYDELFTLLSRLQQTELEIVLLGAAKDDAGKDIIRKCKSFESGNLKIKTYEGSFVGVQEYEDVLKNCHFIYAPLQKHFHGESNLPEQYGLTKSSGVFFDAIRFSKPLLISSTVYLPAEVAPQSVVYHSQDELVQYLTHMTEEEKNRMLQVAQDNSAQFSLLHIRSEFFKTLELQKIR